MSVTINERPWNYNWSKNEIRYLFTIDNLSRAGLHLQVRLMYKVAGTFKELLILPLFPDNEGGIALYIQNYLDSLLEYDLPSIDSPLTHAARQSAIVRIDYREVTNTDYDPDWIEDTFTFAVLKGGVEQEKHSRNNSFINYFISENRFLSYQASGKYIYIDQPQYLSFIQHTYHESLNIYLKVFFADGTIGNDAFTLLTSEDELLFHVRLFDYVSDFLGPDGQHLLKDIAAIEVKLTAEPGGTAMDVSETVRFNILHRPLYDYFDLVYHNSVGGIDSIRLSGEAAIQYERSVEDGGAGMSLTEWQQPVKSHQRNYSAISLTKKRSGDIGYLPSRKQQEVCMEILFSKSIYEVNDGYFIPVLAIAQNTELRKTTDKKYGFALEWKLAISNNSFSPSWINFGAGTI